jgi:hypothetical protein
MNTITRLNADVLFVIQSYLDLKSFLLFAECSSPKIKKLSNTKILIKQFLDFYIPSYFEYENTNNDYFYKLKQWICKKDKIFWEIPMIDGISTFKNRYLHRTVTDKKSGISLIFGGCSTINNASVLLNDVWIMQIEDNNEESKYIKNNKEIYKEKVILKNQPIEKGELDVYDETGIPYASCAHSICLLQGTLYIFGGLVDRNINDDANYTNQFWCIPDIIPFISNSAETSIESNNKRRKISPPKWLNLKSRNQLPHGRWGHTIIPIYDKVFILFGGSSPGVCYNDLWVFCPKRGWKQISVSDSSSDLIPKSRGGHSFSVVGDYAYLIGGNSITQTFNDVWRLSLKKICEVYHINEENSTWTSEYDCNQSVYSFWENISLNTTNQESLPPTIGHTTTVIGHTIIIYGGRDNFGNRFNCGTIYFYDTFKNIWTKAHPGYILTRTEKLLLRVTDKIPIFSITGHAAVPCATGVYFIGGLRSDSATTHDIYKLSIF